MSEHVETHEEEEENTKKKKKTKRVTKPLPRRASKGKNSKAKSLEFIEKSDSDEEMAVDL